MTNTTRRWPAVAVVAALVALSACSSGGDTETSQQAGPVGSVGPDFSTPVVDDGLNHFALTTATSPAGVTAPAEDEITVAADQAAAGSGSLSVTHTDGSVEQRPEVADGSLPAVIAETPAERALLDTTANAVIVVDDNGVLGAAGTRYLHSDTGLVELESEPAAAPASTGLHDVAVAGDESIADALRAVDGVEEVTVVGPGIIAVATSGDAESLLSVPGVQSAEVATPVDLFSEPYQGDQWALGKAGVAGADISVLDAWNVSKGDGVVVAVIDSGVQLNNLDLAPNMWSNIDQPCGAADTDGNAFPGDCHGWDFGSGDADVNPDASSQNSFHGTHVAGIVAAARNGIGIAGVAPEATVMALKVVRPDGTSDTPLMAAAINYAVANGADVINISMGTSGPALRANQSMLEASVAAAQAAGVLIVASMGNKNVDITAAPVWPASFSLFYDNVIAVGASTNIDTKASFSNTGTPLGLYAPGEFILSTMPNNGYAFASGTSMAAPMVAAGAALVIASGQATAPAAVRDRLISTATPIGVGGRLNMAAALGVQADTGVQVTFSGADTLTPDAPGQLGFNIRAVDVGPAAKLRVSVGANSAGAVHAVEGLTASFADANGQLASATTGPDGSFEVMMLRTVATLATTGSDFTAQLTLPAGEFAIVTELLDASNNPVGGAQAAYLSVSAAGSTVTTTSTPTGATPTTTVGGGVTPTTAPRPPVTTTPPGTPTTVKAAPPTTVATTSPGTPTTVAATPITPTTAPTAATPTTEPGTPTTAPVTATTVAAGPTTTSPAATPPATTVAPAPTTTVAGATPTTVGGATPTTVASGPTTAPHDPDADGVWVLDAMSATNAGVAGGTPLALYGNFPTTVPVYVWFGQLAIVQAASTGSQLSLVSPAVPYGAVTDVVVKFATSQAFELTLDGDFTFDGPAAPVTTTTVSAGGTPTTVPATPPATTSPATPGVTTTTRPTVTTQPTVTTRPTQPTTPPMPTSPPVTTQPAVTTTTLFVAARTGVIGQLTLRQVSPKSALAQLNVPVWPAPGCRTAACSSVTIRSARATRAGASSAATIRALQLLS